MNFLAILFALLVEQARPLAHGNWVHAAIRGWVRWASSSLDTGRVAHAWLAWGVAVVVPAALAAAIFWGLWQVSSALAFVWNALILYATLGFRQFSHRFTDIRDALDTGDEAGARQVLARWQQVRVDDLPRSELLRHVIEFSVLSAHRHVFGVLCVFSVFSALGLGPAGAVIYRLSEFVARYWEYKAKTTHHPLSPALRLVAIRSWWVLDYLPSRATALGFAVVGSFEDAIDGWRHHAQQFPVDNDGVVLAATSGAVNVRLGGGAAVPRSEAATDFSGLGGAEPIPSADESQTTPGREPQVAHLAQIVGLVWRSVVLWLLLLALLTLARLLG